MCCGKDDKSKNADTVIMDQMSFNVMVDKQRRHECCINALRLTVAIMQIFFCTLLVGMLKLFIVLSPASSDKDTQVYGATGWLASQLLLLIFTTCTLFMSGCRFPTIGIIIMQFTVHLYATIVISVAFSQVNNGFGISIVAEYGMVLIGGIFGPILIIHGIQLGLYIWMIMKMKSQRRKTNEQYDQLKTAVQLPTGKDETTTQGGKGDATGEGTAGTAEGSSEAVDETKDKNDKKEDQKKTNEEEMKDGKKDSKEDNQEKKTSAEKEKKKSEDKK